MILVCNRFARLYILADTILLKPLVFTLNEISCCFLRIFLCAKSKMPTTIITKSIAPVIPPAITPARLCSDFPPDSLVIFLDFPSGWLVTLFSDFPLCTSVITYIIVKHHGCTMKAQRKLIFSQSSGKKLVYIMHHNKKRWRNVVFSTTLCRSCAARLFSLVAQI